MRKFAVAASLIAVAAGLFGFILRGSQLARAFEPDTGLPVHGAPSTVILLAYIFFVLAAAIAAGIAVGKKLRAKPSFNEAFAPTGGAYLALAGGVAAAFVLAAVLLLLRVKGESKADVVLAGMTAVGGLSIFGLAFAQLRGKQFGLSLVYAVLPELLMTFWLLLIYRANQTNPVRYNYVFQALAVAASAIAFYCTTGFVFGRAAPGKTVSAYVAAIFFLTVGFADGVFAERKIIFVALILYFAVNLARLVLNLEPKEPKTEIKTDADS